MYRFDFDSKEWSKLKPKSDTVPPARFHHTAVVYNGAMVVYGGKTDNANGDSNVHFFDFGTCPVNTPVTYALSALSFFDLKRLRFGSLSHRLETLPLLVMAT
jgi:hypothetical protein